MPEKKYYIVLPNGTGQYYTEEEFKSPNVQLFLNEGTSGAAVFEQDAYTPGQSGDDTDMYTISKGGQSQGYSSAEFGSENVQNWLTNNQDAQIERYRRMTDYDPAPEYESIPGDAPLSPEMGAALAGSVMAGTQAVKAAAANVGQSAQRDGDSVLTAAQKDMLKKQVNPKMGELIAEDVAEKMRTDAILDPGLDEVAQYEIVEKDEDGNFSDKSNRTIIDADEYLARPELQDNDDIQVNRLAMAYLDGEFYNTSYNVKELAAAREQKAKYDEYISQERELRDATREYNQFKDENDAFIAEYERMQDSMRNAKGYNSNVQASVDYLTANREKYDALVAERDRLEGAIQNNPLYQQTNKMINQDSADINERSSELVKTLRGWMNTSENANIDETLADVLEEVTGNRPEPGRATVELNYNERLATAAKHFSDQALDTINAPGKKDNGWKAFGKGAVDTLSDPAFWTRGLSSMLDNNTVKDGFRKIQDKLGKISYEDILDDKKMEQLFTPVERDMLKSYVLSAMAQSQRALDTHKYYQSGKTAIESLGFMAEFLLSGAALKCVGEGLKAGTKAAKLGEWLGKISGFSVADSITAMNEAAALSGKAVSAGQKAALAGKALGMPLAKTALMLPTMPGTYKMYSEKSLEIDDEGQLINPWKAAALTIRDQGLEVWSEQALSPVLEYMGGLVGWGAKGLGLTASPRARMLGDKIEDWVRAGQTSPVLQVLKQGGWDGFLEEMGEEVLNAGIAQIWDKNSWSEFWKPDNVASMAVAFAPMAVFGLGASAVNMRRQQRAYEESRPVMEAILKKYTGRNDEEAHAATDIHGKTFGEVWEQIKDAVNIPAMEGTLTKEEQKAVLQFASASGKKAIADAYFTDLNQKRRNAVDADNIANWGEYSIVDENALAQREDAQATRVARTEALRQIKDNLKRGDKLTIEGHEGEVLSVKEDGVRVDFGKNVKLEDGRDRQVHLVSFEKAGMGMANPIEMPTSTAKADTSVRNVHVVTVDGTRRFIRDDIKAGDTYTYVDENGKRGTMTGAQIAALPAEANTTMPLNQFLDGQIKERQSAEEKQRMDAEKAQKAGDAKKALYVGRDDLRIDVDGNGTIARGVIMGAQGNLYAVKVFDEKGRPYKGIDGKDRIITLPIEQAARAIGMDMDVKTDMEKEKANVAQAAKVANASAFFNRRGPVQFEHNGKSYTFLTSTPVITDEGSSLDVIARDEQGRTQRLSNVDIDAIDNGTPLKGYSVNDIDRRNEMAKEKAAQQDETIAKHTDKNTGDVDEDALMDEDIDAFIKYSDDKFSKDDTDRTLEQRVADLTAATEQAKALMDSKTGNAKKAPRREYMRLRDMLAKAIDANARRKAERGAEVKDKKTAKISVDDYLKRGLNLEEIYQLAVNSMSESQARMDAMPKPVVSTDVEAYTTAKNQYAESMTAEQKVYDMWAKVAGDAQARIAAEEAKRAEAEKKLMEPFESMRKKAEKLAADIEKARTPEALEALAANVAIVNAESGRNLPTTIITELNYAEVMKQDGCKESQIAQVTDLYQKFEDARQYGIADMINGFQVNGKIYVVAEGNINEGQLDISMAHESQHLYNEWQSAEVAAGRMDKKDTLTERIIKAANGKTEAIEDMVLNLAGVDKKRANPYKGRNINYLADEFSAYALEGKEFDEKRLKDAGANDRLINIIKQEYERQKDVNYWSSARRYALDNVNRGANGGNNAVNARVGSADLGEQRPGSVQGGIGQENGAAQVEAAPGTDGGIISEQTAQELADHNLVMDGGAVMDTEHKALKDETGYLTPNEREAALDDVHFSITTLDAWRKNYRQLPDSEERIVNALTNWAERAAADELVSGVISQGEYVYNGKKKVGAGTFAGPIRTNVEYIVTFDMDTTCPRTFQYLNYSKEIERRIGRPLTQTECIQLIEMMRAYGQQIPCVYCYAENKRQALKQYYTNFMEARRGVLSAKTDEEALKYMYGKNGEWAKGGSEDPDTVLTEPAAAVFKEWRRNRANMYNPTMKMLWYEYNGTRNAILSALDSMFAAGQISTKDTDAKITKKAAAALYIRNAQAQKVLAEIVSEWKWDAIEGKEHQGFAPVQETEDEIFADYVNEDALAVWRDMTAYAKSASSAKSVLKYVPYTDELKYLSEEDRNFINGMGGLRMHSSNDFRMDYVLDYFQFMADMAANNMYGHTYTKSPEFVRIFGNSGYRINMSIAAYQDADGTVRMNEDEGFNWETAKELRQQFPNAGTMLMATSDEQVQMALDSDWIDMFIPFHSSGLPVAIWNDMRAWTDYTKYQNEKYYNNADIRAALDEAGIEYDKKMSAKDLEQFFFDQMDIKILRDKNGKRVKPHFLPGPTMVNGVEVPGWHVDGNTPAQDIENYKRLCREYGVRPRFQGLMVKDANGNTIDITDHPGYIKCIKETARMDTPQTAIQFNFDQPSEALGGKTPLDYSLEQLQLLAMAEQENPGQAVSDIYASTKKDPYGIVPQFINTIIKHKEETGKDYPVDFLTPDARKWFLVERRALQEAYSDVAEIPYHPTAYDQDGNPTEENLTDAQRNMLNFIGEAPAEKQVSLRITPEQDREYLNAVQAGDMEKAQRMVADAFKAAFPDTKMVDENGEPVVMYHGSPYYGFNVFYNDFLQVSYFAGNRRDAENYSNNYDEEEEDVTPGVYSVFLNIVNPAIFEPRTPSGDALPVDDAAYDAFNHSIREIQYFSGKSILSDLGYDGAYSKSEDMAVAFNPLQIKSADPVTYDDRGNVIPLSQRFDPESNDIRFRVNQSAINTVNTMQKQPGGAYLTDQDFGEVGDIRFRLSKNNRTTVTNWLDKYYTKQGLEGEAKTNAMNTVIDHIDAMADPTAQLCYAKWFCNGSIRLVEDDEKVFQAVETAKANKVDPMRFKAPMDILDLYQPVEKKLEPINPDTVNTLHKAADIPALGISVYDVDEGRESMENMRQIINTHYGKASSPWCLLQGDGNGGLSSEAETYWNKYNSYPKQVAFKDGKLLAFSASSTAEKLWWDRKDRPHAGLPVTGDIQGDELGRKATFEYDNEGKLMGMSNIFKGNLENGEYTEWDDDGNISLIENRKSGKLDGKRQSFTNGKLDLEEIHDNGNLVSSKQWNAEGTLMSETNVNDNISDSVYYFSDGTTYNHSTTEIGGASTSENFIDGQRTFMDVVNGDQSTSIYSFGDLVISKEEVRGDEPVSVVKAPISTLRNILRRVRAGRRAAARANREDVRDAYEQIISEIRSLIADKSVAVDASLNGGAGGVTVNFRIENQNQEIFVSNAEQAVNGLNMPKATPEQWLKAIQGRGGLKAGEDKWLGLSEWLQSSDKKSITKEEVLNFIAENKIQIEEVHYSENGRMPDEGIDYSRGELPLEVQDFIDRINDEFRDLLYDGVEWREAYNTLAEKYGTRFEEAYDISEQTEGEDYLQWVHQEPLMALAGYKTDSEVTSDDWAINSTRLTYTTEGLANKREIALTVPTIEPWNQSDEVHFGDAGEGRAIAWIRFGETNTRPLYDQMMERLTEKYGDGNVTANISQEEWADLIKARRSSQARVLVIDEIQSKRHQEGREKGYWSPAKQPYLSRAAAAREALISFNTMTAAERRERGLEDNAAYWAEYNRLQAEYHAAVDGVDKTNAVPDAPFEKNWHELAMKRMLRLAAEEGYDYVAWTTGEQQAERYSIGGAVEDIYFAGIFDESFDSDKKVRYIDINLKNGHIYHLGVEENGDIVKEYNGEGAVLKDEYRSFQDKNLADVIGKELTAKVLGMAEGSTLSGDGLHVGGEGMKGFYDDILPRFMDKYGKKWGVKTQDITLPNVEEAGRVMHAVPVTEEMKQSVMEGQPMFRITPQQDAEYMQAVENGDMEKAQQMVDEAAIAAGYDTKAYHGTGNGFNIFYADYRTGGNFFTPQESAAKAYAKANSFGENGVVMPVYLNLGRVFEIDAMESNWDEITTEWEVDSQSDDYDEFFESYNAAQEEALKHRDAVISSYGIADTNDIAKRAKRDGYDSAIIRNVYDLVDDSYESMQDDIVIFTPSRIKSADPVTYDDQGNVIPLSQRFNPESDDIRFRTTQIAPEVRQEMDAIKAAAQADGTFMKAPNGADTNLSEENWLMVRTGNFKSWFGDWENDPENASKVVDRNGEPMVMYHGSRNYGFTIFDTHNELGGGEQDNIGSHFGPKDTAGTFVEDRNGRYDLSKMYSVFLNIRNPYKTWDFFADMWNNAYLEVIQELLIDAKKEDTKKIAERIYDVYPQLKDMDLKDIVTYEEFADDEGLERREKTGVLYETRPDFTKNRDAMVSIIRDMMASEGYDGMVYENMYEGPGEMCWVALEPNQIKSATDNTGGFSNENPDIRFRTSQSPLQEINDLRSELQAKYNGAGQEAWSEEDRQRWADAVDAMVNQQSGEDVRFSVKQIESLPSMETLRSYAAMRPDWKAVYDMAEQTLELQSKYIEDSTDMRELGRVAFNGLNFADSVERRLGRNTSTANFVAAITYRDFAEKVREKLKANNVATRAYSFGPGVVTVDVIDRMFNELNDDERNAALYQRVKIVADKLGVEYKFKKMKKTDGLEGGGYIEYNYAFFNSDLFSDNEKAETILHEMIHGVTEYLISYVEDYPKSASDELKRAVNQLTSVLNEIKKDPAFSEDKVQTKDIHELLAYTTEPAFREKLESKTLWKAVKDAIKKVFSAAFKLFDPRYKNETNALAEVNNALDYFLENADQRLFDYYHKIRKPQSWEKLANTDNLPIFESNEKQSRTNIKNLTRPRAGEASPSSSDTTDEERRGEDWGPILSDQISAEEFSDGDVRFSIRTKPAPEKTGIGYKVFYQKDGKLYPPMVANPNGEATPVGVWLDADAAPIAGTSKTGRPQVKAGGKGTQGGSGTLAYRPGWHLGTIPYAIQFNRKDENGEKTLFPKDFVWAEVEYAADNNYQQEAEAEGINPSGKFQHSLAGLKRLPEDGYYMYRTNPNPETDPWIITGSMKVNKVLTRAEVDALVREAGREPQRVEGDEEGYNATTYANAGEAAERSLELNDNINEVKERGLRADMDAARRSDVMMRVYRDLPEEAKREVIDDVMLGDMDFASATSRYVAGLIAKPEASEAEQAIIDAAAESLMQEMGVMPLNDAKWRLFLDGTTGQGLIGEVGRALVANRLGMDPATMQVKEDIADDVNFRTVMYNENFGAASAYNSSLGVMAAVEESHADMYTAVNRLMDAVVAQTGKEVEPDENIALALNQLSSINFAEKDAYKRDYLRPMWNVIRAMIATGTLADKKDANGKKVSRKKRIRASVDKIARYAMLKHGMERNELFAKRDARKAYQDEYEAKVRRIDADSSLLEWEKAIAKDDAKIDLDSKLAAVDASVYNADVVRAMAKEIARHNAEIENLRARKAAGQDIASDMANENALYRATVKSIAQSWGCDVKYLEKRTNDYSGLMAQFFTDAPIAKRMWRQGEDRQHYAKRKKEARTFTYDNLPDAEEAAAEYVRDMEEQMVIKAEDVAKFNEKNKTNKWRNRELMLAPGQDYSLTDMLWEKINAATDETLVHARESGMIDKDHYDAIRNMFKYYVPLRGFEEETNTDLYAYMTSKGDSDFTAPVLKAKGRKSVAENPFGVIGAMAESGIQQDNKNLAKQALYYFVAARPDNDIISIKECWFEQDVDAEGNKVWKKVYPDLTPGMSQEQITGAWAALDAKMQLKREQGAVVKKGLNKVDLQNAVIIPDAKGTTPEHVIKVMIDGKEQDLFVNGNPRAAQEINGMLNMDADPHGVVKGFMWYNRLQSGLATSLNPNFFLITNFMRDMTYSQFTSLFDHDAKFMAKYDKNIAKLLHAGRIFRLTFNEDGAKTLGLFIEKNNPELVEDYREFVMNGGPTGYTYLTNNVEYEKEMDKYFREQLGNSAKRAVKNFIHTAADISESVEQIGRFAAYLTAKELGMPMKERINAAKEITLNFNRKGSGKALWGKSADAFVTTDNPTLANFQRFAIGLLTTPAVSKLITLFYNAQIQGLTKVINLTKKHPIGMASVFAGQFALGMAMAMINIAAAGGDGDDGDDDPQSESNMENKETKPRINDYINLPTWLRRVSLCIPIGNHKFVAIPLPQEFAPFYAAGDVFATEICKKTRVYPNRKPGAEIAEAFGELLPYNIVEPFTYNGKPEHTFLWGATDMVARNIAGLSTPWSLMMNEKFTGGPIHGEDQFMSDSERAAKVKWTDVKPGTPASYVEFTKWMNRVSGGSEVEAGRFNWHPEDVEFVVEDIAGGAGKFWKQVGELVIDGYVPEDAPLVNRVIKDANGRNKDSYYREEYSWIVYDLLPTIESHVEGYRDIYKRDNGIQDKIEELEALRKAQKGPGSKAAKAEIKSQIDDLKLINDNEALPEKYLKNGEYALWLTIEPMLRKNKDGKVDSKFRTPAIYELDEQIKNTADPEKLEVLNAKRQMLVVEFVDDFVRNYYDIMN